MQVGQEDIFYVHRLIWRGRALSRTPDGKVVIIEPGVFPGEKVLSRISRSKKDYLQAECLQIIEPLPERRAHPCSHSRLCGGCRFGSLPQSRQLELKAQLLENELERAIGTRTDHTSPDRIYRGHPGWRYRWRGQVHVKDKKPYFKSFQGDELEPCADCLLFAPPLSRNLIEICRHLPDGRHTVAASPLELNAVSEHSGEKISLPLSDQGLKVDIPPGTFFQAHQRLNQDLIHYVMEKTRDFGSVADLFAGSGNFSLPLAAEGKRVLAVESDKEALQAIQSSCREFGIDSLQAERLDLHKQEALKALQSFEPGAAVLDPPRSGGGNKLLSITGSKSLQRLVWISCDVVNTCRDLRPFLDSGWQISEIAFFDMFPQTWHMEVVIVLDRG